VDTNMIFRGSWCSKDVAGPYGAGVWKSIRSGVGRFFEICKV
jgi:hypothetical protein